MTAKQAGSKPVAKKTQQPTKPVEKAKTREKLSPKSFADKFRPGTIGRQTVDLIIQGKKSNDEILAEVKKTHKGAETTTACIAWYRSKARAAGVIS